MAYAVAIGFNDPKKVSQIGQGQRTAPDVAPGADGPPGGDGDDLTQLAEAGADASFVSDYFG